MDRHSENENFQLIASYNLYLLVAMAIQVNRWYLDLTQNWLDPNPLWPKLNPFIIWIKIFDCNPTRPESAKHKLDTSSSFIIWIMLFFYQHNIINSNMACLTNQLNSNLHNINPNPTWIIVKSYFDWFWIIWVNSNPT